MPDTTQVVAQLRLVSATGDPDPKTLIKFIKDKASSASEAVDLFRSVESMVATNTRDNDWVSPRSTSKSRTPECFYGKPEEHGSKASTWIFLFKLYLKAEHESFPVAKAVTYLRGEALAWWQTNGMHLLSDNATFDQ